MKKPRLFTPSHRPLHTPGSDKRALRRPDLRGLHTPRPSGTPLGDEVDHDELVIHRSYRVYDDQPGAAGAEVKYFVFEFSQRNPGETEWFSGYKVVRLLRLTRVPRYLRGAAAANGLNLVFQQQRDVLAALREQQVLFLNLVAHAPDMPLAFCYGTQAVGATFEQAAEKADESFEVLRYQLTGTYQQLKVAPLSVDEGERISQYQAQWRNVAMARGRPLPSGGSVPMMGDLDGNRTEAANNQMEAFIRGMSGSSFMLTLVTVPLSPAEMTMAWRNLSTKLSEVRSDQQGARAVTAGVALPLAMGTSLGESHGDSHQTGVNEGVGDSYGVSQSVADSHTVSEAVGVSESVTDGASRSVSVGESHSVSQGVTSSQSVTAGQSLSEGASASMSAAEGTTLAESAQIGQSHTESAAASETVARSAQVGQSLSHAVSQSQSASATESVSQSTATTEGISHGVSVGESATRGSSASVSQGASVNQGASMGTSLSRGETASSSLSETFNATLTQMEGWSESLSESLQQSFNLGHTAGDSINDGESFQDNAGVSGGLFGFNGTNGVTIGDSFGTMINNSESLGTGLTGGATAGSGVSGSQSAAVGQGVTAGESISQSVTAGQSATNSVGQSQSVSSSEGVSSSVGRSVGETLAASQSLSQGLSHGQSVMQGSAVGETLSRGSSLSEGVTHGAGLSRGVSQGTSASQGVSQGVSASQGVSQGQSVTAGQSLASSRGVSESASATSGVSSSESAAVSNSRTQGASRSAGESVGQTVTAGESAGIASNRSLSDAYMVAMSRTASNTGSLGAVPSIGVSLTRQTFDESKRLLGDVLESQMRRFVEGMESGAFLYQLFLVAPDASTLKGAAALMKSAFWGAGSEKRIAQPFHVLTEFDDRAETDRLLDHARCFTSYRRREPVTEEISPFLYSSYITPTELSSLTHPPTSNALGLEAQFDSLPVLAMPANRTSRELFLGQVVDGERGEVSTTRFGLDVEEVTHTLITGVTGSGKTTTLMRYLTELVQIEREVHLTDPASGTVQTKPVRASILGLDWMRNMRNLAGIVDDDRFRFYSVSKPEMGAFRWNLLSIPATGMSAAEWLNQQADNMTASWNLGEFGRSLIAEFLGDLYGANRLVPTVLLDSHVDDDGNVLREGILLPPVDRDELPEGAIQLGPDGREYANVYTCPELSRLVSIEHLATLVMAKVEELRDPDAARLYGTAMRDRLQSLWRRISYFAPGGVLNDLFGCDTSLTARDTLTVTDLIDPDEGKVVIIETDGLDMANRRLILGSVLLAVYRYGLAHGEGVFDHDGQSPGLHVILEEAHELFGEGGEDDDSFSVATRNSLYESLFRRARALGARLVAVAQNPGALPVAVTSNTSTVLVHRCYDTDDRKRIFDLLNWSNQMAQQQREWRFLGEMPVGWCIARMHARESYLESAPVLLRSEIAPVERISDGEMVERAARLGTQR